MTEVLISVAIALVFGFILIRAVRRNAKRNLTEYSGGAGSDTGGITDWDRKEGPMAE